MNVINQCSDVSKYYVDVSKYFVDVTKFRDVQLLIKNGINQCSDVTKKIHR